MCLLLETIRLVNGIPLHLGFHQARVDRSRKALFGEVKPLRLDGLAPPQGIPGAAKWRILYGKEVVESGVMPYMPKRIRSVKLIQCDTISYPFKLADRKVFEDLLALSDACDDILIVRHGMITDLSYANIAFSDGTDWFTPDAPLLEGTCRARLLKEGKLKEIPIRPGDLVNYREATVINAMLDPGEIVFPVSVITP